MHATFNAQALFHHLAEGLGQLHLFGVEVLAGELRQGVDLPLECVIQPAVGVAEVDGRVPHLKVEVRCASLIEQVAAIAPAENLRWIGVVDGVPVGAVLAVLEEKIVCGRCGDGRDVGRD